MVKSILRFLALVSLLAAIPGYATTINYNLTSFGGNNYQYDFTVTNDGSLGAGVPIQLFDILFDPGLYDETSLTVASSAAIDADWAQQFLASAPSVPAAYDAFALGAGISDGTSLSGFAVQFTWLGVTSGPGPVDFEVYDPNSFALLETGTATSPAGVPEPFSLTLLLTGAVAVTVRKRV